MNEWRSHVRLRGTTLRVGGRYLRQVSWVFYPPWLMKLTCRATVVNVGELTTVYCEVLEFEEDLRDKGGVIV